MDTRQIPSIAERHLGARYFVSAPQIKCVTFVCMMYHEAGVSTDFSLQPLIVNNEQLTSEANIGKVIFLMNKNRHSHLFNHMAIIYDDQSVIHYSRHAAPDKVRRVLITSFKDLFEVYYLVPNPYV